MVLTTVMLSIIRYALEEPSESSSEDSEPSTEGFSEAEDSEDEYVPEKKKKKKRDPFETCMFLNMILDNY